MPVPHTLMPVLHTLICRSYILVYASPTYSYMPSYILLYAGPTYSYMRSYILLYASSTYSYMRSYILLYAGPTYSYIWSYIFFCAGHIYWSWCLTPLSAIFQLYRGSQYYWRKQPEIINLYYKIKLFFFTYNLHKYAEYVYQYYTLKNNK